MIHACGQVRFTDWGMCSCGFPGDAEKVAMVERSFNLAATKCDERIRQKSLLVTMFVSLLAVLGVIALITWLR
jgi:hypothetical protein